MEVAHNLQPVPTVWNERKNIYMIQSMTCVKLICYFKGSASPTTQVERPQNGVKSHDFPGSTTEQRVEAKHIPGKSEKI